ncbi:MAG: hypothetical protein ACF8XB_10055 [Planctomycetota bacterium JB042]
MSIVRRLVPFAAALAAAALVPTASAQCGAAGLNVQVFPAAATVGQPIQIIVTNVSPNCTYFIEDSCLYKKVFKSQCGGSVVVPFRPCQIGQQFIQPGQSFLDSWDQTTQVGGQVPPGTYAFNVSVKEVGGGTHSFCPTVTIDVCPTPPSIYGSGSAGTGGYTPSWTVNILPKPGGPFSLTVDEALGGAPALLALGAGQAQIAADFGDFLVDPNLPIVWLPFTMAGTPGLGGTGTVTFGVTVPNDTALVGVTVHCQTLVGDIGSTGGVATTAGLRISICPP